MSADWPIVRLGALVSVKHGFAFDGDRFVETPTPDVLMTPGNFEIGGGFKLDNPKYYDGPVPPEYILQPGDVIVTMTDLSKNSDTLGYSAVVPYSERQRFLHNQRIGKLVVKTEVADLRFLHWALRSPRYRAEVLASASGSTVKHTAPSRIEAFEFRLPPLPDQRAIASILGALDDKIDLNRRMNETLEDLARTIFKSWFVDFDPVRAKAEGRQPVGMDAETAALFPSRFVESELGEIPEGWEVNALDEIAQYRNGLALQNFRPEDREASLPVIKISQLRSGVPDSGEWARADVDAECVIDDGDVVFSWSGSLMVDLWCGGRGALNQHLFKVTSNAYPKWFFYYWTAHHLTVFQSIAADKATTMGHIKRHHLHDAKTVNAPSSFLAAASRLLEPLIERQVASRKESRTLASLRDILLPKLISGELRVPDAEKLAEAVL